MQYTVEHLIPNRITGQAAYLCDSALWASDDMALIQDQIVPGSSLQDVNVSPQGLIAHDQHIMAGSLLQQCSALLRGALDNLGGQDTLTEELDDLMGPVIGQGRGTNDQ